MNKCYTYQNPYYQIEVLGTGIFCILIFLVCIWCIVTNQFIGRALGFLFAIPAGYQVWNTFVSLSNPQKVCIDETNDTLTFSGLGRCDTYKLSELSAFLVRPFPSSGKLYIRVNNHNLLKGRYWVPTKVFSDGKELFDWCLEKEYTLHPDTLKARARRVNQEYIDNADEIKALRAKNKNKIKKKK